MKIGVSTSLARPGEGVVEVMRRAAEAGFDCFELGVLPRRKDVEEIGRACEANRWTVLSVHNVVLNERLEKNDIWGDLLSSTDEKLRLEAVEDLRRTLEVAERLGAFAVVVHGGVVPIPGDWRTRYNALYRAVDEHDEEARAEMLRERKRRALPALEATARSLEEILRRDSVVRLALESRNFYDQIPSPDELAWIFRRFDTDRLAYWHDTGHARLTELVGLAKEGEWLSEFADRLVGIHLHDMRRWRDHLPIGHGNMDFAAILSRLGDSFLPIIEPNEEWSGEELLSSARYLSTLGFGEFA
ncbi:MAG: sugar phosphate isomerase/epimerase family protein [Planctomycetota bacterium]